VEVRIPEPFVLGPTVTADTPEKSLVPAAGGLNITAVDEGLGAHGKLYPAMPVAECPTGKTLALFGDRPQSETGTGGSLHELS
jgi:hypothetical protein